VYVRMIRTGYVSSVTGLCLAQFGHGVIYIDHNTAKVKTMQSGESPIFEPGLLSELMTAAIANRKIRFFLMQQLYATISATLRCCE
jgi:UDPglucose 6-dehydrogenase